MSVIVSRTEDQSACVESVRAAVAATFAAILGEAPKLSPPGRPVTPSPSVAGIISFAGSASWSLSLVLNEEVAPGLVRSFAGFDVPFDSRDMGDAVCELVNVLAGEVVCQVERRGGKAQMSLPMVARGCPLELMAARHSKVTRLDYDTRHGRLWLAIVSPVQAA
jgi:CheY-specific phosphatase CheX